MASKKSAFSANVVAQSMLISGGGTPTLTETDVDRYAIEHISVKPGVISPPGLAASISCVLNNRHVAFLAFISEGEVPENYVYQTTLPSERVIMLNFALSRLSEIVDAIGQAKAFRISFNHVSKVGTILTNFRPIGQY